MKVVVMGVSGQIRHNKVLHMIKDVIYYVKLGL